MSTEFERLRARLFEARSYGDRAEAWARALPRFYDLLDELHHDLGPDHLSYVGGAGMLTARFPCGVGKVHIEFCPPTLEEPGFVGVSKDGTRVTIRLGAGGWTVAGRPLSIETLAGAFNVVLDGGR